MELLYQQVNKLIFPPLLLMAEILHQFIGSLIILFIGFHTSQVVQDFSHQQYHLHLGVVSFPKNFPFQKPPFAAQQNLRCRKIWIKATNSRGL